MQHRRTVTILLHSPSDPPAGGDLLLSVADRAGSYEESNPTASKPFTVAVGEDVEYDWNLETNGAATSTPYCFRMTKADGEFFDAYDFYPTIWTAGYVPETRNWRWYDDGPAYACPRGARAPVCCDD